MKIKTMFILSNFICLYWQRWLLFQNNNQFVKKNSLQFFCDNFSCVLTWALIIFTSIITFILTSKNDKYDNHNFNFCLCWKVTILTFTHVEKYQIWIIYTKFLYFIQLYLNIITWMRRFLFWSVKDVCL